MEKVFIQLIAQNQGIIHKVCALYLDNEEDRRDLFQEILIQLWKAYPSFRNESKISTWMYRVALNTAISQFRKQSRKPKNSAISALTFQVADNPYNFEYEEKLKMLKEAIDKLSKVEKAIMMLYLEEHNYEEIAETVGITQNNLRVKINRIKNKLKELVNAR